MPNPVDWNSVKNMQFVHRDGSEYQGPPKKEKVIHKGARKAATYGAMSGGLGAAVAGGVIDYFYQSQPSNQPTASVNVPGYSIPAVHNEVIGNVPSQLVTVTGFTNENDKLGGIPGTPINSKDYGSIGGTPTLDGNGHVIMNPVAPHTVTGLGIGTVVSAQHDITAPRLDPSNPFTWQNSSGNTIGSPPSCALASGSTYSCTLTDSYNTGYLLKAVPNVKTDPIYTTPDGKTQYATYDAQFSPLIDWMQLLKLAGGTALAAGAITAVAGYILARVRE